jgi:FKBP12-rapamycin complex-associated protein
LRKIKGLPQFSTLELHHASPKLLDALDLELAIPGTYEVGQRKSFFVLFFQTYLALALVQIKSFNPQLSVFHTKQKPRKLTICGSDGFEYVFLLKGHEDLRQDERVMQLFGLVNTLLAKR